MAQISGNTCDIITLLPLGLDCDSINASTPLTNNGMVSLFVTGGTPPYTINWSNGAQGSYIFNLFPGDYSATVVDFYGDFTATTTCSVGFNQFNLDKFISCENSSTIKYFTAPNTTTSNFAINRIYNLQNQTGCWVYKGRELTTGQTYFSYSAVSTGGPYLKCIQCTGDEEPLPFFPLMASAMCMTVNVDLIAPLPDTVSKIQFYSASTLNGRQSWTSSTPSYRIYYNSGTTKWNVSGWTYQGVPQQMDTNNSPIGNWTVFGSNDVTMSVSSGVCVSLPILKVQAVNASCTNASDGSVLLSVTPGTGTPPYLYSLDNQSFQASPTFVGLTQGSYTAYVKDALQNTDSQSFTIASSSSPTQYSIKFYEQPIATPQVNNISKSTTINHTWFVDVTPSLPAGKKITFNLVHNIKLDKQTGKYLTSNVTPTLIHNLSTGFTGGGNITGKTVSTPVLVSDTANKYCDGNNSSTAYTITYNCVIIGSGTIKGEVYKKIITPNTSQGSCPTSGQITDAFSINNLKFDITNKCDSYKVDGSERFVLSRTGTVVAVAEGDSPPAAVS